MRPHVSDNRQKMHVSDLGLRQVIKKLKPALNLKKYIIAEKMHQIMF